MTGGFLQLVAKSLEDIILIGEPEITFFKIVYRRHSNFSIENKTLRFDSAVDFGKTCRCRLRNYGDYISKMYIVLDIPFVDIKYKTMTFGDIINTLNDYNIVWNADVQLNTIVTDDNIYILEDFLDDYLNELENEKAFISDNPNSIINKLTNIKADTIIYDNYTNDELFDAIFDELMTLDQYNIAHQFLSTYKTLELVRYIDNDGNVSIRPIGSINMPDGTTIIDKNTSITLLDKYRNLLWQGLKKGIIPDSQLTFNDDNMLFLSTIDNGIYHVGTLDSGINAKDFILDSIDIKVNTIHKLANSNSLNYELLYDKISHNFYDYTLFDSYKITSQFFNKNNRDIFISNDVNDVLAQLSDHIFNGLLNNIKLLTKIYTGLGKDFRFTFYKKYSKISGTNNYESINDFINLSTVDPNKYYENFTSWLKLPKSSKDTNVTHFYGEYVESFIDAYHAQNRSYFNNYIPSTYFNEKVLWDLIKLENTLLDTELMSHYTGDDLTYMNAIATRYNNIHFLNLVPVITINDIYNAISLQIQSVFDKLGSNSENLYGLHDIALSYMNGITKQLKGQINLNFLLSGTVPIGTNIPENTTTKILENIENTYISSSDDVLLVGQFRKLILDSINEELIIGKFNYDLSNYIKNMYTAMMYEIIADYNTQYKKNMLNTNLHYVSVAIAYTDKKAEINMTITCDYYPFKINSELYDFSLENNRNNRYYFKLYSEKLKKLYIIWYCYEGDNIDMNPIPPINHIINDSEYNNTIEYVRIDVNSGDLNIAEKTYDALINVVDIDNFFSFAYALNNITITYINTGPTIQPSVSTMPYKLLLGDASESNLTWSYVNNGIPYKIHINGNQDGSSFNTNGEASYFLIYDNNEDNIIIKCLWFKTNGIVTIPSIDTVEIDNYHEIDIDGLTLQNDIFDAIINTLNSLDNFEAYKSSDYGVIETDMQYVFTINTQNQFIEGPEIIAHGSDVEKALYEIINMFHMRYDSNVNKLPDFTSYKNNGYTLYQVNDVDTEIQNSFTKTSIADVNSDAISSIWYTITQNLIDNYNDFYNYKILEETYFEKNMGLSIRGYYEKVLQEPIDDSEKTYFNIYNQDTGYINYYAATQEQSDWITGSSFYGGYLSLLQLYASKYKENGKLLKLFEQELDFDMYKYATFLDMKNHVQSKIYISYAPTYNNTVIIDKYAHGSLGYEYYTYLINSEFVKEFPSYTVDNNPHGYYATPLYGTMDFYSFMQYIKNLFYDNNNNNILSAVPIGDPDNDDNIMDNLKDTLIQPLNSDQRAQEKLLFDNIINLSSSVLYKNNNIIQTNYNGFNIADDFYNYMINIIREKSIFSNLLQLKAKNMSKTDSENKNDTYANIINYFTNRLNQINNTISLLRGTSTTKSLFNIIKDMISGKSIPKFAWIEYLGHYILESIHIDIGGEIIDTHTGEIIHMMNELNSTKEKDRGYNKMIGNIPELYTYNNHINNKTTLYIPINFFYCNRKSTPLPIGALHHTYADVVVKFNKLQDCAYWEKNTIFKKRPKLSAYLIADYIYLEHSERKILMSAKHEILIETMQTAQEYINKYSLDNGYYTSRLKFNNLGKEIIFAAQKSSYVDGTYSSLQFSEKYENNKYKQDSELVNIKSPHYYGIDEYGNKNPIETVTILFNGIVREQEKDGEYYNYVNPHKVHSKIPNDGIMVYPLSLYPMILQPSGTANFSQISDVEFKFKFKQEIINEMNEKNIYLRIVYYIPTYNIIRIMSGMAGLAFYA